MTNASLFSEPATKPKSVFDGGMAAYLDALIAEMKALYLADKIPWICGYSGGKDSSATLQLTWMMLVSLPPDQRHKPVHVVCTDTLVENPIIAQWAENSLAAMQKAATEQGLPIHVHRLRPKVEESFWVLLIGKGYPAPRRTMRWCTDRLKIRPSNEFIMNTISAHGETILLLGTRKAESAVRARRMEKLEAQRVRDLLSPNANLHGSLVYTPIEAWSNDDVWLFLMQHKNPWGWDNKGLLTLYQGASEGGECPLVIDTSTPSCGASRFGCWVCTLVEQDKSMTAMVENDEEKDWMRPLLRFRNDLDFRLHEDGDRPIRDYRRMRGRVDLMQVGGNYRVIPGPYTQAARADWLRKLLTVEREVRRMGPPEVQHMELISTAELHEIRRIWVLEKHEIEDLLPGIVEEVRGVPFPCDPLGPSGFVPKDLALLREACDGDEHLYRLARDLLAVEHDYRTHARRAGLFKALDGVLARYAFRSEEEAVEALAPIRRDLFTVTRLDAAASPEEREAAARRLMGQEARTALGKAAEKSQTIAPLAEKAIEDLTEEVQR